MASVAVLALFLFTPAAGAAEPALEIALDAQATNLTVVVYDVHAADEVDFLEAITTTGGFIGEQAGFAVEKIVRSIEGPVNGDVRYWVLTRHYNLPAMQIVQQKRSLAVSPYIASLPTVRHTSVDRHQFPNWGYERNETVEFTKEEPLKELSVLQEYGTSLAFFKYGYTGQTGWIQEHPANRQLSAVQADVLQYDGLSGVSLTHTGTGSVLTYGEFFSTPSSLASQQRRGKNSGISGLGTVILNYRER